MSECYQKRHNSLTCNRAVFPFQIFFSNYPALSFVYRCVIKSATRRLPPLSSHLRTCVLRIPPCMQISVPRTHPALPFSTFPTLSRPLEWMDELSDRRERKMLCHHDACLGIDEILREKWEFEKSLYQLCHLLFYLYRHATSSFLRSKKI